MEKLAKSDALPRACNISNESNGTLKPADGDGQPDEAKNCWLETCLKPAHGKPNWEGNFVDYEERLGSAYTTVEDCNGDTIRFHMHKGICMKPLVNFAQILADGMQFNVTDRDIWLASYNRSGNVVLGTIGMGKPRYV